MTQADPEITIFIDADACPVTRETLAIARSRGVAVVLVGNETQNVSRFDDRKGVSSVQVGVGRDAADFAIIERLSPGDIVVTQDLGVAAMVLGRGAHAISPRGRVHSAMTIDMDLAVRHAEQQHRRAGGRTKGPSPFEEDDRDRFEISLKRLLG